MPQSARTQFGRFGSLESDDNSASGRTKQPAMRVTRLSTINGAVQCGRKRRYESSRLRLMSDIIVDSGTPFPSTPDGWREGLFSQTINKRCPTSEDLLLENRLEGATSQSPG